MQQEEAICKIAPLPLSLSGTHFHFPLHLLPTQTARRASGNNCQIHRLTSAPFLACICFAIWVCVCVCVYVPRLLDANRCQGYCIPLRLNSSTHLTHTPLSPSLPLSLVYNHSQLAPLSPLTAAASHCMAFTSFRDTWGALGLNEVHTPSCTSKRAADRDATAATDAVDAAN